MEFFMYFGIRYVYRMCDQKKFWPSSVLDTRSQTLPNFVNIYLGPLFLVHYKYSFLLNIVFVTFMYGSVMPILFPIAWFQIFIFYCTERLMVYYSYQRPPMYDDAITKSCINLMYGAPCILLIFAAWAYSNEQVFHNYAPVLNKDFVYAETGHYLSQFFHQLTPATPLIIGFFAVCIVFVLQKYVRKLTSKIFDRIDALEIASMTLVQDLPNFTDSLKPWMRTSNLKIHSNSMQRLGLHRSKVVEKRIL